MTTRKPRRSPADTLTACVVWSVMLSAAALETFLLFHLVASTGAHGFDGFNLYASNVALVLFWLYCLIVEWVRRYNRPSARRARRLGWIIQGMFLGLAAAGAWQDKDAGLLWGAAFVIAIAQTAWAAWLSTTALHPDDQKVVDEAIAEQERLRAERLQREDQQRRKAQLEHVLAQLHTSNPRSPESGQAEPELRWNLPKGRHEPFVYFMTNGDRVKIGTTTDIRARVRRLALRPENVALILPGGRDVERSLHRRFADKRVGTSEWFRHTGSLAQFITDEYAKICAAAQSQEGPR